MQAIKQINGGRARVRTPLVRKGFFYKPLHAEPHNFKMSIVQFDKANNDYLEFRFRNRSREEKEREKQRMKPDLLFAMALRKLFDKKSDGDVRESLEDISLAMHKGADIAPALEELHSLKPYDDYWPIAANLLAEYYISKDRREKVIELLDEEHPYVRMSVIDVLAAEAYQNTDVSFYVPLVYPLMKDLDENVCEAASDFLIRCALSSNPKLREAFQKLRDDILSDILREIESE